MKATDILSNEHRIIEQILACMEKLIAVDDGESFPISQAKDILDFLKNFADRCHHGKEEVHLFAAMEGKGFSPTQGPTAVMRSEHEQGRQFIAEMTRSVDALQSDGKDCEARQQFNKSAKNYVMLLGQHIHKEDHVLFPMAENCLSEQEQEELLSNFTRVEKEEMGEGTHESYLELADRIADFFGVDKTSSSQSPKSCGCSH